MSEIHICTGANKRYCARVRMPGFRKYEVGKMRKSFAIAMQDLFKMFDKTFYQRGDVVMTADYYSPVQIVEITRK